MDKTYEMTCHKCGKPMTIHVYTDYERLYVVTHQRCPWCGFWENRLMPIVRPEQMEESE
jgi:DNA-directed RNA polymerase subunit RPC12/RpoP